MKRMVLIPEERLLRYEERDKQKPENEIMYGRGEEGEPQEDSLSVEMIVRGIPKTMKTRAEALLAHLKERGDVYGGLGVPFTIFIFLKNFKYILILF